MLLRKQCYFANCKSWHTLHQCKHEQLRIPQLIIDIRIVGSKIVDSLWSVVFSIVVKEENEIAAPYFTRWSVGWLWGKYQFHNYSCILFDEYDINQTYIEYVYHGIIIIVIMLHVWIAIKKIKPEIFYWYWFILFTKCYISISTVYGQINE